MARQPYVSDTRACLHYPRNARNFTNVTAENRFMFQQGTDSLSEDYPPRIRVESGSRLDHKVDIGAY